MPPRSPVSESNEASLALGGLDGGAAITSTLVQELDDAHDELERAEELVWKGKGLARQAAVVAAFLAVLCLVILIEGWGPSVGGLPVVPLLAGLTVAGTGGFVAWLRTVPRRRVATAKAREIAALETAGVSTYLAFQMRRIDPTLNKNAGQTLEVAIADQRRTMRGGRRWPRTSHPRRPSPWRTRSAPTPPPCASSTVTAPTRSVAV